MNSKERLLNYLSQRSRGIQISLFLAVCVVYLPFLGNPFVFDDIPFFHGDLAEQFTHSIFKLELRWLPNASLAWTASIFTDVLTYPFRLGNMLLHGANVILLYLLLRQLMRAILTENEDQATIVWGAWFGALIFACHPVAVYAVGYVIERSILMATLFSLVAQLAYLQGLQDGKYRWLALAVGAYFLACFAKEHSVMILGLLAAQTVLLRPKIAVGKIALGATWLALVSVAVLLMHELFLSKSVMGVAYEPMVGNSLGQHGLVENPMNLHVLSALSQSALFFKYLMLWWIPDPAWMSVDMREYFASSWSNWQGLLGATSFAAYGILGGWLLLRKGWQGLVGLALLYPWLQFVVEFSTIRVQEPFVLYRSYLWMPGLMLLIPLLLHKLTEFCKQLHVARLVFGGIVLLLVTLAWNRLWVFADDYRLWNDAALLLRSDNEVGADRIFYNRGNDELAAQKWEEASVDFQKSLALAPQLAPIHHHLGLAYINTNRYQDALAQFDAAIALAPENASYYYLKGMALKRLHQDEPAIEQMKKSCELKNMGACLIVQMQQFRKK